MSKSHSNPLLLQERKIISEEELNSLHVTIKKMKEQSLISVEWITKDETNFEIVHNPKLNNFYILEKKLGQGGYGAVYLAYPIKITPKQITIINQPSVIKKSRILSDTVQDTVLKEVAGLSKLYSDISFVITNDYSYIFSGYLPGQAIIPEQELANEILTVNKEIEKLSFCQRLFVSSEIARQLYRVNTAAISEELPENGEARIHGDIKGSNFHLYIDEDGLIQISLLDFGTSEKVLIENDIVKPVVLDDFVGSFGHITRGMISPVSSSENFQDEKNLYSPQSTNGSETTSSLENTSSPQSKSSRQTPQSPSSPKTPKYEKTIGDDIHNCAPIIGCLLGANNPYIDKAMAVYDSVIAQEIAKYDLHVVNNINDFKLSEQKKPCIVLSKDESERYSVFYYSYKLDSFITIGDNYLQYALNDSEAEKKLSEPLSITDQSFFIKKALQLKGDIEYKKLKTNQRHYMAEQNVPYNFTGLYNHDLYKNWLATQTYVEKFLQRMQGIEKKSNQATPLESRLFWGALYYFCDQNEKNVKNKSIDLSHWQATFDLLLTDELQNNSLPKMKQFRELIQLFFARMDENNLQDKMKKEMNLFWETINGFISAYKNPSSVDNTLPYLTKLAILSTLGLSREAWGNDFKRYDEVNNDTYFNETVIALSKDEDPISKRALTLLFTTVPPVRNAVLELYKNDSFIEKRELLLKKLGECSSYLGPSSVRAIELAKNILNRSTLDLKTVSSTQFNEIYNAIKKSPEYNPSFLDHLNPNLSKFKENDKLKLEELKKGIHEARDDFERFKLIQDFIKTNPALLITQKIAPLILEQRTVISSQRISNL